MTDIFTTDDVWLDLNKVYQNQKNNMNTSRETELWLDLTDLYHLNKRKIDKNLFTKNEKCLFEFCFGIESNQLEYNYLCKLVLIFANILKRKMPEHMHNRIILDVQNEYTKKYIKYIENLKQNKYFIFNLNDNEFKSYSLGIGGILRRMAHK